MILKKKSGLFRKKAEPEVTESAGSELTEDELNNVIGGVDEGELNCIYWAPEIASSGGNCPIPDHKGNFSGVKCCATCRYRDG